MRVIQLTFPFEGAPPPLEIKESRVSFRGLAAIEMLEPTLNGLHVKRSELKDILGYPEDHYRRVLIGSSGKHVVCWSPSPTLRKIQKCVTNWIIRRVDLGVIGDFSGHEAAYWRHCSIIRNARFHRRSQSNLTLDLRGAFENVTTRHIERYLTRELLWLDRDGFIDFVLAPQAKINAAAWLFSRLLTFRGRLRRGPPSSPIVFNLMMRRLDRDLEKALGVEFREDSHLRSEREEIVYTRYGDDLCFSAPTPEFPQWAVSAIEQVVASHGLRLNRRKRIFGKNGVLVMPGVVVKNGRMRPTGKYIARLAEARKRGMPDSVLDGHRAFVRQFGHSGKLSSLRPLLNS